METTKQQKMPLKLITYPIAGFIFGSFLGAVCATLLGFTWWYTGAKTQYPLWKRVLVTTGLTLLPIVFVFLDAFFFY